MPVGSAMAAVMPTTSGRSSAIATSSSAKTWVHFTVGGGEQLAGLDVERAAGPCRQSASSSSAGR